MTETRTKKLHFNKPQRLSYLFRAHEEYAVWGRGTGKSEGLISPRSAHNIASMPRGCGVFVGATYKQILTRTLPPVIAGWERLGYKKDIHFVIGKRPPEWWRRNGYKEPYVSPLQFDYFISWYNGSGIHLVSQDRPGTSNGLSVDWIIGDEAKLLSKDKLEQELFPTNRGNGQYFGHLPEHHSILFATDMPTSPKGKWILDKQDQMIEWSDQFEKEHGYDPMSVILSIQAKIQDIRSGSLKLNKKQQEQAERTIREYEITLQQIRFGSIYYSEFSTLENVDVLGIEYIKQMRRVLPDLAFRAAILGERILQVEEGFYPHLDEEYHGYEAIDYHHIDNLEYDFDKLNADSCLHDADIDQSRPLDIALDYGASINPLVVGQEHYEKDGPVFRFVNAFHVKHPDLTADVVLKFCEYYKDYRTKEVNYFHDHTAVGTDGRTKLSYRDIVTDTLRGQGWDVNQVYFGQAPNHRSKYELWAMVLREKEPRLPKVRFNLSNCKYLLISMQQAEVIQTIKEIQKNKKPERIKSIPQEETTHYSDAADMLYIGKFASNLQAIPEFTDLLTY